MQDYINDFISYATDITDKEACGLIVNNKFIPCKNLSIDPHNFIIDPIDYANATKLGKISHVCHTHLTESAKPTQADIYSCNKTKLPWVIYSIKSKTLEYLLPESYNVPLIGRAYHFGTLDCWSIICDVYMQELNIKIGRFIITDEDWYKEGINIFEEQAKNYGFSKVIDNSLKKYDVLLFKAGFSKIPNHSGIMYDNNTFIHHLANRLSNREIYGGFWNKCTVGVYRHETLL